MGAALFALAFHACTIAVAIAYADGRVTSAWASSQVDDGADERRMEKPR